MTGTDATNALLQYQNANQNAGKSIANEQVSGFDFSKTLFVQSGGKTTRNGKISAASPTAVYQKSRDTKADAVSTGKTGDLAIDGPGFFVVKNLQGTTALSSMGSFRIDGVDKKITGPSGEILMGWKVDNTGGIPASSTSVDSLEELSVKGLNALAEASSRITVLARLSEDQKLLDGPGDVINLARFNAAKAAGIDSIITPGENGNGSLRIGDEIELTPVGNIVSHRYQFGGVAPTREVDANSSLFGSVSPTQAFQMADVGVVPNPNQIQVGQVLRIAVGGAGGRNYDFTASKAADKTSDGEFNSLSSLAKAINVFSKGEVRANIGSDNRLYISAKNANTSLSFSNIGAPVGRNLVEELGLVDVVENDPGASGFERYTTLKELRTKIELTDALRASLDPTSKRVTFSSERATGSLSINGKSSQPRLFQHTYYGDKDNLLAGSNTDSNNRSLITISSPGHGLVAGDHIRIADPNGALGALAVAGNVVRVVATSPDAILIASDNYNTPIANDPLARGTQFANHGANPVATSWQKVEGAFNDNDTGIPTQLNTAISARNAGGIGANFVTVTLNIGGAVGAQVNRAHFVAGDMVHITNSAVLKNGVYRISAVGAGAPPGTITVQAKSTAGANPAATDDLTAAVRGGVGGNVADPGAQIVKVAQNAAVNGSTGIDTFPIRIAANSNRVTISKTALGGGHEHKEGDVLIFRNLAAPQIAVGAGNIAINENTPYRIVASDDNTVTFEADSNDANPARNGANEARIGMYRFDLGAGAGLQNGAVAAGVSTSLGRNFTVEYVGKAFKGLGITTDTDYFASPHEATYDPLNNTKNMASGIVKPHHVHTVQVHDSLGDKHDVKIAYARITDNEWAVEVFVPEQEDGTYDIIGQQNQVAADNIFFDGKGKLTSIGQGLQGKIRLSWKNGADASEIEIDFGEAIGAVDNSTGNLTLSAGEYDTEDLHANGHAAGNLDGIEYLDDGSIVARFSNGSSRVFAKLPVAMVADPNSLIAIGRGHFVANEQKSGVVILKQAGQGGAGVFNPGFLTGSGVDSISTILGMNELAHTQKALFKTFSIEDEVKKAALASV